MAPVAPPVPTPVVAFVLSSEAVFWNPSFFIRSRSGHKSSNFEIDKSLPKGAYLDQFLLRDLMVQLCWCATPRRTY